MTRLNIISGFLGSGKTTLIRKIIPRMSGKLALIENELGENGIDGALIGDDIPKKEVYAGCICCSIANEFNRSVEELVLEHRPERLLIEPSGVGSLSEIMNICHRLAQNKSLDIMVDPAITLVDVSAYHDYIDSFGSFYMDQIKNAGVILLSYAKSQSKENIDEVITSIHHLNPTAFILSEDWLDMPDDQLLDTIESAFVNHDHMGFGRIPPVDIPKFNSISIRDPRIFKQKELDSFLDNLGHKKFGKVLRAKGFIRLESREMVHFDFTPQHTCWEHTTADQSPNIVVIGLQLEKEIITEHFK